jgi:hypothetical protein
VASHGRRRQIPKRRNSWRKWLREIDPDEGVVGVGLEAVAAV